MSLVDDLTWRTPLLEAKCVQPGPPAGGRMQAGAWSHRDLFGPALPRSPSRAQGGCYNPPHYGVLGHLRGSVNGGGTGWLYASGR